MRTKRTTAYAASNLPNIVIIQPDDIPFFWPEKPKLGTSWNAQRYYETPAIDKLRTEGVTFLRAYGASSTCAPGRYSVWTGRYPSRSKYSHEKMNACGWSSSANVDVKVRATKIDSEVEAGIGKILQNVGYKTGAFGKWHLHEESGSSSWFTDELTKTIGTKYADAQSAVRSAGVDTAEGIYITNMDNDCDSNGLCAASLGFSHNAEWVTASANTFIEETVNANASQPFFVMFTPTSPHSPDLSEAIDTISVRQTPAGTLSSDPVSGMPSRTDQKARFNGENTNRALGAATVDMMVESLYKKLESLNVLDDTLIIFLMDNGQPGKQLSYEPGARIAMFARYPKHSFFVANSTREGYVQNIDILPTIIEITGAQIPSGFDVDGSSWLSNAGIDSVATSRAIYFQNNQDRAVVYKGYKLLRRYGDASYPSQTGCGYDGTSSDSRAANLYPSSTSAYQLYDLTNDEEEQTNLYANSVYAEIQSELQTLLACHENATKYGGTASYRTCSDSTTNSSIVPSPSAAPNLSPSASPASRASLFRIPLLLLIVVCL